MQTCEPCGTGCAAAASTHPAHAAMQLLRCWPGSDGGRPRPAPRPRPQTSGPTDRCVLRADRVLPGCGATDLVDPRTGELPRPAQSGQDDQPVHARLPCHHGLGAALVRLPHRAALPAQGRGLQLPHSAQRRMSMCALSPACCSCLAAGPLGLNHALGERPGCAQTPLRRGPAWGTPPSQHHRQGPTEAQLCAPV